MPFLVYCVTCGSEYSAADEAVGRNVKCAKCGTIFAVPADMKPAPNPPVARPASRTAPPLPIAPPVRPPVAAPVARKASSSDTDPERRDWTTMVAVCVVVLAVVAVGGFLLGYGQGRRVGDGRLTEAEASLAAAEDREKTTEGERRVAVAERRDFEARLTAAVAARPYASIRSRQRRAHSHLVPRELRLRRRPRRLEPRPGHPASAERMRSRPSL